MVISNGSAKKKGSPKRLKAFLLTHPLYKSPSLLAEGGVVALDDKRQYCVTKPKAALQSTLLNMSTGG